MTTTDLVPSISIDNLVNQRNGVLDKLTQALALLREAYGLAVSAHVGFPDIGMNCGGGRHIDHRITGSYSQTQPPLVETAAQCIDAGAWAYLMNQSGLRTFMDATARQEWDAKVHARDVPPLTLDNITATFTSLRASRGEMFERGVINCFRVLSWDYKTNQPFKFGKRLVLTRLFNVYGKCADRWLSVNHDRADQLNDLDRVFHLLDGKPEPDHRSGWGHRLAVAKHTTKQAASAYVEARHFLNGNGHLTFIRPELVDKLNEILAKHHPNALASKVRAR